MLRSKQRLLAVVALAALALFSIGVIMWNRPHVAPGFVEPVTTQAPEGSSIAVEGTATQYDATTAASEQSSTQLESRRESVHRSSGVTILCRNHAGLILQGAVIHLVPRIEDDVSVLPRDELWSIDPVEFLTK